MSDRDPVVIVGAGHAGVQAAASLREEKFAGPILLACDEPHAPYQRPPLSKAYVKRLVTRDSLALRGPAFYAEQGIDTVFGDKVVAIDRTAKIVAFASGRRQPYSHLVLATGARAREEHTHRAFRLPSATHDNRCELMPRTVERSTAVSD